MSVVLEATLYSFTEAEIDTELSNRKEIWARDLKNARSDILNRLLTVFKDFSTFSDIMMKRQIPGYEAYINPNHPKAKKAITKLKRKWNEPEVYTKWSTEVQSAFAEGGAFDVGVDKAKEDWYRRTKVVAMVVGIRPVGLSLAPKLYMLLRGLDTTPYELAVDNVVTRPTASLIDPNIPDYVSMAVIPTIVDGAYNYITNYKNKLNTLISKLLASGLTLDAFDFLYDEGVDRFKIYIKVSQTSS